MNEVVSQILGGLFGIGIGLVMLVLFWRCVDGKWFWEI